MDGLNLCPEVEQAPANAGVLPPEAAAKWPRDAAELPKGPRQRQELALSTLQDNLQLLRGVEAKSQASLDSARAKDREMCLEL